MWFAVLFSLSSLAIRGSLLEALVVVTHIDYLIPAATPPLGGTARMVMAMLIAALGFYVGRNVGRRIAQSEANAARTISEPVYGVPPEHGYAHDYAFPPEAAPRRPFQVHEVVEGHYPIENGAWTQGGAAAYPDAPSAPTGCSGDYPTQQQFGHQPYELGHEAVYAAPHEGPWPQPYSEGSYQPTPYQPAYPAQPQPHTPVGYGAAWTAHTADVGTSSVVDGGLFTASHSASPFGQPPLDQWPSEHWPSDYQHADAWPPAPTQPQAGPADASCFAAGHAEGTPSHGGAGYPAVASPTQPWAEASGYEGGAPAAVWQPAADGVVHVSAFDQGTSRSQSSLAQSGFETAAAQTPEPATLQTAAERLGGETLEQLSNVELMERLAMALQRQEADQPANAVSGDGVPTANRPPVDPATGAAMPARSALAALRGLR